MRVLCTGDLHIGRRSSRIPAGLDGKRFSCSAGWDVVVETAIQQRVDLVAISGDVADRSNRYFEAFGPLESGIRALSNAGIQTVAVAGNHDFDVLPRLVDTVGSDGFRLLGRGGTWERETVTQGGETLHVDGWSFPSEHVHSHPLHAYRPTNRDGVPVLALLHADLDQLQSRYCPVALADLQRQPVALWLLGHIHAPRLIAPPGVPTVLYPGSPQAMDPGEDGAHGPWIVDIQPGGQVEASQLPTSTARYQALMVDVTGLDDPSAVEQRIALAARDALQEISDTGDQAGLICVCFRLTLTGRTPLHRRLAATLDDSLRDIAVQNGPVTGVIEKISYATRPAVDLEVLSRRNDPPGEVARLLLALESDPLPSTYEGLIARAVERLRAIHQSKPYLPVGDDPAPDASDARRYLATEGFSLLDTLLAQKETL